jgi:hypothetical protein
MKRTLIGVNGCECHLLYPIADSVGNVAQGVASAGGCSKVLGVNVTLVSGIFILRFLSALLCFLLGETQRTSYANALLCYYSRNSPQLAILSAPSQAISHSRA